jgi:hypothetical protein
MPGGEKRGVSNRLKIRDEREMQMSKKGKLTTSADGGEGDEE